MMKRLLLSCGLWLLFLPSGAWALHEPGSPMTHASFDAWLAAFRKEAEVKGISPATLDRAFAEIRFLPRVIELDRRQPEFTLTLAEYLQRVVPERRVRQGRAKLREQRERLQRVAERYGVQPRFLVALWGIETDFGRLTGGFNALSALATLAYEGRRAQYFRGQLIDALRIVDAGHIPAREMTGSWAGALGQTQFMPSTFLGYAVDGDGDGHIDLWHSLDDVFASAAHYLASMGWDGHYTWGRPVRLPAGAPEAWVGQERPLEVWRERGLSRVDGRPLPQAAGLPATLIRPDGPQGQAYLTYPNYQVLLKWNRADSFAVAVGTLADRIVGRD